MRVVFAIDSRRDVTCGYYWSNEGVTGEKMVLSDGSLRGRVLGSAEERNLWWVVERLGNEYIGMRPAEVKDLSTADKYLGKSADLIELLPRAEFSDEEKLAGSQGI